MRPACASDTRRFRSRFALLAGALLHGTTSDRTHFALEMQGPSSAGFGVLGYSQGAYIAAQVAPADPAIDALALEGVVADFTEQTRAEFARWSVLSQWPALLARVMAGYRLSDPQPAQLMDGYRRPLWIVTGEEDRTVPAAHADEVFARARGPKQLRVVPGAHHGDYASVAPREYAARLTAFFEGALLDPRSGP